MEQPAAALDSTHLNNSSLNLGRTVHKTSSNIEFSEYLRRGMGAGAGFAANTLNEIGPAVPGAAVLSNVLSGAAARLNGMGPNPSLGGGIAGSSNAFGGAGMPSGRAGFMTTIKDMQENMMSTNLYMISLQKKFQQINQMFTTVSNVLKMRHDTEKNSIANIR